MELVRYGLVRGAVAYISFVRAWKKILIVSSSENHLLNETFRKNKNWNILLSFILLSILSGVVENNEEKLHKQYRNFCAIIFIFWKIYTRILQIIIDKKRKKQILIGVDLASGNNNNSDNNKNESECYNFQKTWKEFT